MRFDAEIASSLAVDRGECRDRPGGDTASRRINLRRPADTYASESRGFGRRENISDLCPEHCFRRGGLLV